MDTHGLVKLLRKGATTGAMTLGIAFPAAAGDVKIEYGGEAHAESEMQDMVLAAVSRDVLGSVPAGWSHVVVFRSEGTGTELSLEGNGAALGALPAGTYVVVAVPAGEHRFRAGEAELPLRVAPGHAYFLRVSDRDGNGGVRLQRTTVMAFDQASRRMAGL